MIQKKILLPIFLKQDNSKAFCFATELAQNYNMDIVVQVIDEKAPLKDIEINEIYMHLLHLKGYYHGQFKQWQSFKNPKVICKISDGCVEKDLINTLTEENIFLVLFPYQSLIKSFISKNIVNLLCYKKTKVFILPEWNSFFETIPNQASDLFILHKNSMLNQIINKIEIHNLPEDSELLKNKMFYECYVD